MSETPVPTPLFAADSSHVDLPDPKALAKGLTIERVFSREGEHPLDSVSWERREAAIKNHKGEAIFLQKDVEFPTSWSQLATNVVASKYFYGDLSRSGEDPATGGREHSLKQLIHRVTRTIADWGTAQGYFATKADGERFYDELTWLCVNQYGSFNSPVWFNVGLHHQYGVRDTGGKTIYGWDAKKKAVVAVDPYERPQASACFIISVDDSIDDIWKLMGESARLFKFGSGVGADWSRLRSTREKLSGGGTPSGPVSFMRVQDATGGTIKSGGKTRRAAIMQTLKVHHPDIVEFVEAKQTEEKKAWALIEQGYDGSFNGPAYGSVAFQNVNQSVRVTDAFMQAATKGERFGLRSVTTDEVAEEVDAKTILDGIAEGTYICGDPGVQYEDTIQRWHTCKNTAPINSSNPCCFTGDTLVETSEGPIAFEKLYRRAAAGEPLPRVLTVGIPAGFEDEAEPVEAQINKVWVAGQATALIELTTTSGVCVRCTPEHRFLRGSDLTWMEAQALQVGDLLVAQRGTKDIRVETLRRIAPDQPVTVYDLEVESLHSFSVTSPGAGEGVIAHNSEYMFLDDSACNLASLNLRKFQREDGSFDVERFRAASRTFITAMEILVDNAGYPSASIAKNSHDYRPLGLGFANLGALLMSMGFAYDSDEGRAVAGAIMAIEHGEAYARSAEIAANPKIGPFAGFAQNREPMLDVMRMHAAAVDDIHPACPDALLDAARETWTRCLALGEAYGYRNAQATVLAPTGTIAFMMDCDTTGIEPDIALVKYKLLAGKGDGLLKIVNQTVPEALRRLGYGEAERQAILDYVDQNDTIEGAPHLKEEHLAIFDCAFKPARGERSIHHMGHIQMMAAVQPFISGAISKCVTGDTLVFTEQGIVPIGQFYNGEAPDSFRKMQMKLASIDEPQDADLFYYGGVRPTIKLTLADGRTLEGTPNHRVKVANEDGYDWKFLSQITTADHVAIRIGTDMWAQQDVAITFVPSHYGSQKQIRVPARMSGELGWLIGAYIAEGNKNRSNWTVCITNNHPAVLERCQAAVEALFGLEGRIVEDPRNGVKSFVVASKSLFELLNWLGCDGDAGTKEIPWSILQSTRETMRAFIGGLWLDGYVRRKDGMVAICLKSETLIRQLQVLMNNFGIRANIIQKHNKVYDRTFHQLCIHGRDVCRFAALFSLDEPHKRRSLADAAAALAETPDGAWSDVVPCFRAEMQQTIYANHDTQAWRNVMDPRTKNVSRKTAVDFYERYALPELAEIVENDVHFVQVQAVEAGVNEVYDFHVPTNHAFLGNGIVNHNTVNMPETSTVEDIADAYVQGWKLGLKAVAIYRENSKRSQPLSTKAGGNTKNKQAEGSGDGVASKVEPEIIEKIVEKIVHKPLRKRLPDERPSLTHKFSIAGHEGYLHIGLYPDTQMPGEIFITMAKQGSTISGLMDAFATAISIALQYGVPLEDLCNKFSHMRFEPSGFTNNRQIPIAKSMMDYIFRYLSLKFLGRQREDEPVNPNDAVEGEMKRIGPAADETQMELTFDDAPRRSRDPLVGQTIETFMAAAEHAHAKKASIHLEKMDVEVSFQNQEDAPPCPNCGSITVRAGSCYSCPNCGSTSGCG